MANKKTQKDFFNEIIAELEKNGRDDLIEFCNDRIDKLGRKSSSKKPTKTQVENGDIKEKIIEILGELDSPVSATALATDPRINVSNQKITSLLTQLKKEQRIIRIEEKGKALFMVMPAETEPEENDD